MRHETPRFALVVWLDDAIGCIPLADVAVAVRDRAAVVVAVEDADLCAPPATAPVNVQHGMNRSPRQQADGFSSDEGD